MKQTLNAVAIAATVLAVVPAWAQSPTTSPSTEVPNASGPITHVRPSAAATTMQPNPAASAPEPAAGNAAAPAETETGAATEETAPRRHARRAHRAARHTAHRARRTRGMARSGGRRGASSSDNMAEQLNRQEAERGGAGVAPPTPARAMPPGSAMPGPSRTE